jgi:hypothetical protein
LQVASNAAFAFGTGDFSMEFWFYPTVAATQRNISFPTANAPILNMTSSRTLEFGNYGISTIATTSNTLTLNAWNFCAASRVSGTLRLFINGVQGASVSDSTNFVQSLVNIGTDTGGIFATGYMADVRIVKGSGFTTSTVPTAPLTAISGTSLLTCQSNRFRDASGNGFTITTSGSPSVTPFSPFAPTSSYSAAAVGGSGYFDGTGDYLTAADNAAFDLPGDFTIEMWVYASASPGGTKSFINHSDAASTGWALGFNGTGTNLFWYTNSSFILNTSSGLVLNAWNHVAAVRSGTSLVIYINGTSAGSVTNSTSYAGTGLLYVGSDQYNQSFVGTLSGVRIVKGQALASGNFTPPSAPVTTSTVGWTGANAAGSLTGTVSLLLNFTNAGVVDATAKNVLETVGSAQISTTQSKWGGGSIRFDGTADALRIPDDEKENLRFGTGNFTIEFWAWKSANGSMDYDTVISIGSTGSYNGGFSVELSASRGFCFIYDNAVRIQSNFNPNDSTWNHYAVVRDGSTFALYKNGSRLTTATLTPTLGITGTAYVGAGALTDNSFNGYIDDLRVSKGLARYTGSTYTVPTAPFPVQ